MPSTNQAGTNSKQYDSDAKKMLAEKNDLTIAALIRGIRKVDRAREWVDAEVDLAADEGRRPRKDIIGALNRRITALQGNEDGKVVSDVAPDPAVATDAGAD